jgi:hypothetical protein
MENTNAPKFVIVYGCVDTFEPAGLSHVLVSSLDEAKALATQFLSVIPDNVDRELNAISAWDGTSKFEVNHQDDDHFYFSAFPLVADSTAVAKFTDWVEEFDAAY